MVHYVFDELSLSILLVFLRETVLISRTRIPLSYPNSFEDSEQLTFTSKDEHHPSTTNLSQSDSNHAQRWF